MNNALHRPQLAWTLDKAHSGRRLGQHYREAAMSGEQIHHKRLGHPAAKCPRHPKKEYREIIEKCWAQGAWCEERHDGIWICHPDTSQQGTLIHKTPNRRARAFENTVALLRRRGFAL
jgi:hypothetical protein